MLAAAFALMPLPAMMNVQASPVPQMSGTLLPGPAQPAQTYVNRAGVAVNGTMKGAVDPVKIGDVYYVPFKETAGLLDYDDIRYNSATKTYTATDGSYTIKVSIGNTRAMKGDEPIDITPPKFINGNTYLTLDALSAVFNVFAYYKTENGSVQIQLPARQYRVQAGDTLWEIASSHHTTVTAVRNANGIWTNNLTVGQTLRLPSETDTKEMEPVRTAPAPQPAPLPVQQPQPAQDAPAATSISGKQQAVINTAKQYIGVPYKFGAKPEQAPSVFDCSSYIQYVFKQNGISLPRDSRQQSAVGTQVTALQPGDLLFFKYPERYSDGRVGHVGIYIGNGQMIHTVPSTGVTITKYQSSGYWTRNFLFAKRVIL